MRITLLAIGSRGDVQPYLPFGRGLAARGHEVRVAASRIYGDLVAAAGLEFAPLAFDPTVADPLAPSEDDKPEVSPGEKARDWVRFGRAGLFDGLYDGLVEVTKACEGSEVIAYSHMGLAGFSLAERDGILGCQVLMHPRVPAVSARHLLRYQAFLRTLWLLVRGPMNRWRREVLGLPPLGYFPERRFDLEPTLFAYSPATVPPPRRRRPRQEITGVWTEPGPWATPAGALANPGVWPEFAARADPATGAVPGGPAEFAEWADPATAWADPGTRADPATAGARPGERAGSGAEWADPAAWDEPGTRTDPATVGSRPGEGAEPGAAWAGPGAAWAGPGAAWAGPGAGADPAVAWEPPAELAAFLAAGPPPVYVALDRITQRADPERALRIVPEALRAAGVRAVLSGDPDRLPRGDGLLPVADVPHDWLFRHVAAVVHHGGAGTTASAFLAGAPAVVLPVGADQPFWAERVAALGAGIALPPFERASGPDELAAAIRAVVGEPRHRERAGVIGRRMAAEDGVGRACDLIEEWAGARR